MHQLHIDPDSNIEEFDNLLQEYGMLPDFYVTGASPSTIIGGLRTLPLAPLGWQIETEDSTVIRICPTSTPLQDEVRLLAFFENKNRIALKMFWSWPLSSPEAVPTLRFDEFVKRHEPIGLILRRFNSIHGTILRLQHQKRRDLIPHISPTVNAKLKRLARMEINGKIHRYEWHAIFNLVESMKYMSRFPGPKEFQFLLKLHRFDKHAASQFNDAYSHLVRFHEYRLNRL